MLLTKLVLMFPESLVLSAGGLRPGMVVSPLLSSGELE